MPRIFSAFLNFEFWTLNFSLSPSDNSVVDPIAPTERIRRGLCLLNAALYDQAIAELDVAAQSLADAGQPCADPHESAIESIHALREAIAADPENNRLHFQLGTLLATEGCAEEAELRFAQVLSISRDHVEAIVALAMLHLQRDEIRQGISLLQRAQSLRPGDAKIALLLARSVKLVHQRGQAIDVCAVVAND